MAEPFQIAILYVCLAALAVLLISLVLLELRQTGGRLVRRLKLVWLTALALVVLICGCGEKGEAKTEGLAATDAAPTASALNDVERAITEIERNAASLASWVKLYAACGTFYYWFYGLEKEAGFYFWSGPHPLSCFRMDIWNKRPDNFEQRIVRKLREAYGMDASQELRAKDAIRSITFEETGISLTWNNLIVVSPDPVLAAEVANASMEVLCELDLEFQKGIRKNKMFKIMRFAEIATNIVTGEVAQRMQKQRERWNRLAAAHEPEAHAEIVPTPSGSPDVEVDVGDL